MENLKENGKLKEKMRKRKLRKKELRKKEN